MAVDLGVFDRQKTIVDQQQLQDAFDLKRALVLGQLERMQNGGLNTPSSVREWQFYNQIPEDQRENYMRLKRADQVINLGGQQGVRNPVTGQLEQVYQVTPKPEQMPDFKGRQRAAELEQDLKTKPEIERRVKEAEATVAKSVKNTDDIKKLRDIQKNLKRYATAAKSTNFTGPVLGRIGDIVQAPGRTNLKSVTNELTLRAKELLNFPNANFSNSDREFIQDVAGGKYAQYGGIEKIIGRLSETTQEQIDNILQSGQPQLGGQQQQAGEPPLSQQRRLRFNLQTGELE
jgi:hypothetical protein